VKKTKNQQELDNYTIEMNKVKEKIADQVQRLRVVTEKLNNIIQVTVT